MATCSEEEYQTLVRDKEWLAAINAVLLQEAGGVVEITKEALKSIDLTRTQFEIRYNEESETYTIEGVFNELESTS